MRTLADIAAIAATILAVASLVPQIRKLRRLGSAEGVSPTWAALGAATNVAWFAYLFHEALWASVPAPFLMTGFYAATFYYVHRAGKAFGRSALASAAWGAALFVSLVVGGWTFLGLVLGGSYVVQVAPSVWAAYRTRRPSSVAPATWIIILVEAALWGLYGWYHSDVAFLLFSGTAAAASLLILGRYAATRHRWAAESAPV